MLWAWVRRGLMYFNPPFPNVICYLTSLCPTERSSYSSEPCSSDSHGQHSRVIGHTGAPYSAKGQRDWNFFCRRTRSKSQTEQLEGQGIA